VITTIVNLVNRKEVIENTKGDVCLGHLGRGFHDCGTGKSTVSLHGERCWTRERDMKRR
jgi:predicted nucleic acid binding AN1-type Zn finger protein